MKSGELDEIFFAYSQLEPGDHPEGDEETAALLVQGARAAAAEEDHHMALSLATIARRLEPESPHSALLFARAAMEMEMRGAAAEALDEALSHSPEDGELLYERARLAEKENDLGLASRLYERVPEGHERRDVAEAGSKRVTESLGEKEEKLEEVAQIQEELIEKQREASQSLAEERRQGSRAQAERRPETKQDAGERPSCPREESTGGRGPPTRRGDAPSGMEVVESSSFRIVYNRGERDFAQRSGFEHRILEMLEDARRRVGRLFRYRQTEPIEVVLYTAEEFKLHFGGQLGQSVLGFYAGKIRINRAEDPRDPMFRRTVVHEYVHAIVDQIAGGNDQRIPIWLNEGLAVWAEQRITGASDEAELPAPQRRYWREAASSLSLSRLTRTPFGAFGNPMPAYIKSRAAVEALVGTGGRLRQVLQVIEDTGAGESFEAAFAEQFGPRRLERLDEEANRVLAD